MRQKIHVYPLNDLREHHFDKPCWCNPVEDDEYPWIIIHSSMDGREKFESGERKPS